MGVGGLYCPTGRNVLSHYDYKREISDNLPSDDWTTSNAAYSIWYVKARDRNKWNLQRPVSRSGQLTAVKEEDRRRREYPQNTYVQ